MTTRKQLNKQISDFWDRDIDFMADLNLLSLEYIEKNDIKSAKIVDECLKIFRKSFKGEIK